MEKRAADVPLEHDRASVRRGKIFATQEERDYTEQLWQMYTEHQELQNKTAKSGKNPCTRSMPSQSFTESEMYTAEKPVLSEIFHTDVQDIV